MIYHPSSSFQTLCLQSCRSSCDGKGPHLTQWQCSPWKPMETYGNLTSPLTLRCLHHAFAGLLSAHPAHGQDLPIDTWQFVTVRATNLRNEGFSSNLFQL